MEENSDSVDKLDELEAFQQELERTDPDMFKANEALLDNAADCVAFCEALNTLFQENGFLEPDTPTDLAVLEGVVDSVFLELFAAVMFMSAISDNDSVAKSLQLTADSLENTEKVPVEIIKGYRMLADRVEKTRLAKKELLDSVGSSDTITP